MKPALFEQIWGNLGADSPQMIEEEYVLTFTHDGSDNYVLAKKCEVGGNETQTAHKEQIRDDEHSQCDV